MRVIVATSPEAGSGKTTALVAIGQILRRTGRRVDYARLSGPGAVEDATFVTGVLRLPYPASVVRNPADLIGGSRPSAFDILLIEANGGQIIDPDLMTADHSEVQLLVVARYAVDGLAARVEEFSHRLKVPSAQVLLNSVPDKGLRQVQQRVVPDLRATGRKILAVIRQDRILLGMSVGDLATGLGAEVLCATDQLSLPVEAVMIAAMSDEGAETYFRRISRKAVVADGERPDIHMPALATDTSCIVLTEGHDPDPTVFKTADQQGVPLLKVTPGTMPTLENISNVLRQTRFRQSHKVARAIAVFDASLDRPTLLAELGVTRQEVAS